MFDTRLELEILNLEETEDMSFLQWHRRLEEEHSQLLLSGGNVFTMWKWCSTACTPCRWFDQIDYNARICKCCRFRHVASFITFILICSFIYLIMFVLFEDKVLPGGTFFFLGLMFSSAFAVRNLLQYIEGPGMLGMLLVGMLFGNLPRHVLLAYNDDEITMLVKYFEHIILVIAMIRAGLLLDMTRLQGRVLFILRLSMFPLLCEFTILTIASHYLLDLPWQWSALQGSILCPVSFSSVISCMEKNKYHGYGEDKHLSTVLIAASSSEIIFGIFVYGACIAAIFPLGYLWGTKWWEVMAALAVQTLLGIASGSLLGLLAAFFPDRRHKMAPISRILFIGTASLALIIGFDKLGQVGAGLLSTITMNVIASNMWEELGWHESSNPVLYFYAMFYYAIQPILVSLVGFAIKFTKMELTETALSIAVIFLGLMAREFMCFLMLFSKAYPINCKEKMFICMSWLPKGAVEACLAILLQQKVHAYEDYLIKEGLLEEFQEYADILMQTCVLAVFITGPIGLYGMTFLAPHLLNQNVNRIQ